MNDRRLLGFHIAAAVLALPASLSMPSPLRAQGTPAQGTPAQETPAQRTPVMPPEIDVRGVVATMNSTTVATLIVRGVVQSKASCASLGATNAQPCRLRWSIAPSMNRPPTAVLRVELLDGARVVKSVWSKMASPGTKPTAAFLHDISRMTHALEAQQEEAF